MNKSLRLFSAALILALAFSAAFTISAFADEGTPPTDPAPTEEPAPNGEPLPTVEPAPAEEALPTEEPAPVDDGTAAPTEPAPEGEEALPIEEAAPSQGDMTVVEPTLSDDSASEGSIEVSDVLAVLPEGTELTVLDENGEALSLASDEAADVISISDPIWCPSAVGTPVAGPSGWLGGCSPSFNTFNDLITWLTTNDPNVAGTIWFDKTYDSGSVACGLCIIPDIGDGLFTLNGTSFANLDLFALTIKGGWNGIGTNTITIGDPSEFNGKLQIINWQNNITLSDILITGTSGGTPLEITTTKNIVLTRVNVDNTVSSNAQGAYINNSGAGNTGTVTISNSVFSNNNNNAGLRVYSNGMITLTSVVASGNVGGGAMLDNSTGTTGVTVSNSTFSNNTSSAGGLTIYSKGTITLNNVTANSNVNGGATLDNSAGTGSVTISNSTFSNGPTGDGLEIDSKGTITLSNVTANNNAGLGGDLENCVFSVLNCTGTGSVVISNSTFGAISNGNDGGGLDVASGGAITLTNVKANENGTGGSGFGANLDNSSAVLAKNVTVTSTVGNWNEFSRNQSYGLQITSKGLVSVKDVTASENGLGGTGGGLIINNTNGTMGVTFTGTNIFNDNDDDGLWIVSKGVVTLNSVIANSNGDAINDYGVEVDNTFGTTPGVTLNGTNQFNFNYDDNLFVVSHGLITLNNITANSSQTGDGAYIYNLDGTAGVTIKGTNYFVDNDDSGLLVTTKGAIIANSLNANYNGTGGSGDGAFLVNTASTLFAGVTLTGTNTFNANQTTGLEIQSKGAIVINSVTASNNVTQYGINLTNIDSLNVALKKGITLTGTNVANGNNQLGLVAYSYGAITVNNLTAMWNGGTSDDGVYLDNCLWNTTVLLLCAPTTPQPVTINVANISNNADNGLWVVSGGAIKLTSVVANENGFGSAASYAVGIRLDSCNEYHNGIVYICGIPSMQTVTLSSAQANDNGAMGIWVTTSGAITGSNLKATGNGFDPGASYLYGAWLDNCIAEFNGTTYYCSSPSPKPVTLTGSSNFSGNKYTGLLVYAHGAISLNSITSNDSDPSISASGAELQNAWMGNELVQQNVTLTGTNVFNGNDYYGLRVFSYGQISLNSVTASNNLLGAILDNCQWNGSTSSCPGLLAKSVLLTGTNIFNDNTGGTGLSITSRGAVSASNVTAKDNNSGYGAYIDNCLNYDSDPTPTSYYICGVTGQNVTISGTNVFSGNAYGIGVYSAGAISINNLTASDNTNSGANLDNCNIDYPSSLCTNTLVKNVILTGTNVANKNLNGHGIYIASNGAVTVNSLTASDNAPGAYGYGALIENYWANSMQNVTFTGTNSFVGNDDGGLSILSKGMVSVNSVKASETTNGFGVYFSNTDADPTAPKDVKITGTNTFNDNGGQGLAVYSLGTIYLNSTTANNNGGTGAILHNCNEDILIDHYICDVNFAKGIILTGANTFNENFSNGLDIWSSGAVSSSTSLTINYNGSYGLYLVNSTVNAVGGVSLLGMNSFIGNKYTGAEIYTRGNVALDDVTANENGLVGTYGSGVYVDACIWTDIDYGVPGPTYACLGIGNITVTGTNKFIGNYHSGLNIYAAGNITGSNVTGSENGNSGAYLYNADVEGKTVALTGTNVFNANGQHGLTVYSKGSITVNSMTASYNSFSGAYLRNDSATLSEPAIKITGTNVFNENTNYGLLLTSRGDITLNNITASHNNFGGAILSNNSGLVNNVTLTGVNEFSYNASDHGLAINTNGAVSLAKVTADGNASRGLYIYGLATNVTISCGWISGNASNGIYANYSGLITLKGVIVAGNAATNVYNDTSDDGTPGFPDLVTVRSC